MRFLFRNKLQQIWVARKLTRSAFIIYVMLFN